MSQPAHISEIIERWRERQREWLRLHVQVDGAALASEIVADLEQIASGDGQSTLTLTAASQLSGYSSDHLSRLIRDGKLSNHGRKGKPLIRRSELPMRPRAAIANGGNGRYSPVTDARSLRVRR